MGQITLSIPQVGSLNATEDPKIASDLTTIQTVINGNLDATNISASLAQAAVVNQGGQIVKGVTNTATSESRTNTAYGTLTTPDQVTGLVLPTNGLIAVWFQGMWQESVGGAARAAIFIGANQLRLGGLDTVSPANVPTRVAAATQPASGANVNRTLLTCSAGLACDSGGGMTEVTTGQAMGGVGFTEGIYMDFVDATFSPTVQALNLSASGGVVPIPLGGPCYIFAAAGTYTVSVQFKSSSGSVTASNRKLWVQALSFA